MPKNKYNIPDEIFAEYEAEDSVFLANEDDRDLDTIEVPLPKSPEWDTIDGFGLKKVDQIFQYQVIPPKLIALQDEQDSNGDYLTQDELWERINDEYEYYADAVEWIKLQWERRLNGYWCFIFGKPTYITGWHYVYLNFWEIAEGRVEFRDRDRRYFLFADFVYKDKKMYGFIIPKGRRVGLTASASCIMYCIATVLQRARVGIQSKDDKSAEDLFQKHIVPGWRAMPFFFKPNTSNSDDPKKILHFSSFITKGKIGAKKRGKKSLQSEISYRASGVKAWDGSKLHGAIQDEIGKLIECNINDRWRTIKLCLSLGGGSQIHGYCILGSTVGEMEQGGGQNMLELCNGSKWSERNKSGQTATGLCILYIPSYDGLAGFIGKYGESIIENPTKEQIAYLKKRPDWNGEIIGAKAYLEGKIEHLKALGDKDGIADEQREFPTSFRGCFRTNGRDSFFDIPKIEERLDELNEMVTGTSQGNFEWEGPKFRSRVRFVPDPDKGKFKVSLVLPPEKSNMVSWDARIESYIALNDTKYSAGADPFKSRKTKAKTNSKGGGAVYWGHDITLDPFEKQMDQWESCRLLCTYLHRPDDKDEFSEDMIMMCLYYGCPMYAETNVQDLVDDFTDWGFSGMLIHKYNTVKDKVEELPGQATGEKTHQEIFKLIQRHIKYHCHRERHADFLEQVRDIQSTEEMTKYDLFSAVGYAMLGFQQFGAHVQRFTKPDSSQDLTDFIPEYSY